jgi:hypothetical protein
LAAVEQPEPLIVAVADQIQLCLQLLLPVVAVAEVTLLVRA